MPALRSRKVTRGQWTYRYSIFPGTGKRYLCQSFMLNDKGTEALWQSLKTAAATRRWWAQKTGQDFDPCPKRGEHLWRPFGDQGPPHLMVTTCMKCGEERKGK